MQKMIHNDNLQKKKLEGQISNFFAKKIGGLRGTPIYGQSARIFVPLIFNIRWDQFFDMHIFKYLLYQKFHERHTLDL